jgi:hypothetical protein
MPPLAGALPAGAAAPPLAGVALAFEPKIAPMIFPKMLIVCSQSNEDEDFMKIRTALWRTGVAPIAKEINRLEFSCQCGTETPEPS